MAWRISRKGFPVLDVAGLSTSIHLQDVARTTEELVQSIREAARRFGRTEAVVALSGGIDSSVCVALAARALGPERVTALTLPDKESSKETSGLALQVARHFGAQPVERDITGVLEALGCYADRLAVVRRRDPDFDPEQDTFSVEFALGEGERLPSFSLNVVRGGESTRLRLGGHDFLTIMAATNQKQRVRMMLSYRWADEHNGLVIGTSNRLELEQGFFVKHGDGCGDVFPLRHLVKTQVFELAAQLGVPDSIQKRTPTTDTFSAPQTQEEYFYGAATETGDDLWLAYYNREDQAAVAARHGLTVADVDKFFGVYRRRAAYADYLRETI
jgi:NAD+ synthase